MERCRCRVEQLTNVSMVIEFCPLHKAADELLEVAKQISRAARTCALRDWFPVKLRIELDNIIAKAERE